MSRPRSRATARGPARSARRVAGRCPRRVKTTLPLARNVVTSSHPISSKLAHSCSLRGLAAPDVDPAQEGGVARHQRAARTGSPTAIVPSSRMSARRPPRCTSARKTAARRSAPPRCTVRPDPCRGSANASDGELVADEAVQLDAARDDVAAMLVRTEPAVSNDSHTSASIMVRALPAHAGGKRPVAGDVADLPRAHALRARARRRRTPTRHPPRARRESPQPLQAPRAPPAAAAGRARRRAARPRTRPRSPTPGYS